MAATTTINRFVHIGFLAGCPRCGSYQSWRRPIASRSRKACLPSGLALPQPCAPCTAKASTPCWNKVLPSVACDSVLKPPMPMRAPEANKRRAREEVIAITCPSCACTPRSMVSGAPSGAQLVRGLGAQTSGHAVATECGLPAAYTSYGMRAAQASSQHRAHPSRSLAPSRRT